MKIRRMGGALVAVAIGVALVVLALLLLVAGRPKTPDRLAGAPVLVQAPQSGSPAEAFPPTVPWSAAKADELSRRLDAVAGVALAVPDRVFYVQALVNGRPPVVEGQRQDTYEGHGWSSARLGGLALVAGAPPRGPGEVVVDQHLGIQPGGSVTLLMATGPARYTVSGLVDAPGYLVADDVAAQLAPGVRAIGLVLEPGADPGTVAAAAREAVGGDGKVLSGDERGVLEPRDDARARWIGMQVLTGVSALAGFVTVFVVASTFAFTVAQRRRELGLLRAVGATPRQVRRMVFGEALLVGGVGAVLGVILGAAVAPVVGRLLVGAGLEPATYEVRYSVLPLLVGLLLGPVVALLGAWSAARRAARVRPLEALREAAVEQRPMGRLRWGVGGALVVLGIAFAVGTATADDAQDGASFALYSAIALVSGMVALAPAAVPPIVRLWQLPFQRGGGAVGLLVRQGALTAARRTASTAAPVLLTVAFAVLVAGMVQTTTAAYASGRAADVDAGDVLVPDRTPGLSDAAVAGVPGAAMLPTTVFAPDEASGLPMRAWSALGVDTAAFNRADRGAQVISGSLAELSGADTVVVSESAHRAVGDAYAVVFADGELVPLRVVAVVADRSIRADVLLDRQTVRRHDLSALTSAVYLPSEGSVSVPTGVGARVVSLVTWAAEADSAEDRLVWVFTLMLIAVSAGYGAIAVANTLLMAAQGRAADLRVMRLAGATRRQVAGYVAAESVLVVLIGAVLGGVVAFGALVSIRAGLSQQVGAAVELVVPWSVIGGVVALCLVLALLAGVLPTRRMLRERAIRMSS
ncbi:FtsX-like permease family protein [Dactylosporangium sp. NPDC051541]|uniref:ABC transporter permease n=1 Tax=Dactylosporangium sp. NPDC051541 TaxID=3363977 RepID=UPI0037AFE434